MIKFSQQKAAGIGDVNLTPMIDIIFNLLIFFLIVARHLPKGIELGLARDQHGGEASAQESRDHSDEGPSHSVRRHGSGRGVSRDPAAVGEREARRPNEPRTSC